MQTVTSAPTLREEQFQNRGFWALVATQFQGAFNDNLYRYIITFYMLSLFRTVPDNEAPYLYLGYFPPSTFVPAFAAFLFWAALHSISAIPP